MIETSFFELKMKNVINVIDGKNLGHISDIVLEVCSAKVLGIVVPSPRKWYSIFKSCEDIFIPYHNICKIGEDCILIELCITEPRNFQNSKFKDACDDQLSSCISSTPPEKLPKREPNYKFCNQTKKHYYDLNFNEHL